MSGGVSTSYRWLVIPDNPDAEPDRELVGGKAWSLWRMRSLGLRVPPAFVVTTDSRHLLPVYPNLARQITATAVNQLWVADITYIRLRKEFVYLAVLLDAFSRRVIGWALGRSLEAGLALSALRMALRQRRPAPCCPPPLMRPCRCPAGWTTCWPCCA